MTSSDTSEIQISGKYQYSLLTGRRRINSLPPLDISQRSIALDEIDGPTVTKTIFTGNRSGKNKGDSSEMTSPLISSPYHSPLTERRKIISLSSLETAHRSITFDEIEIDVPMVVKAILAGNRSISRIALHSWYSWLPMQEQLLEKLLTSLELNDKEQARRVDGFARRLLLKDLSLPIEEAARQRIIKQLQSLFLKVREVSSELSSLKQEEAIANAHKICFPLLRDEFPRILLEKFSIKNDEPREHPLLDDKLSLKNKVRPYARSFQQTESSSIENILDPCYNCFNSILATIGIDADSLLKKKGFKLLLRPIDRITKLRFAHFSLAELDRAGWKTQEGLDHSPHLLLFVKLFDGISHLFAYWLLQAEEIKPFFARYKQLYDALIRLNRKKHNRFLVEALEGTLSLHPISRLLNNQTAMTQTAGNLTLQELDQQTKGFSLPSMIFYMRTFHKLHDKIHEYDVKTSIPLSLLRDHSLGKEGLHLQQKKFLKKYRNHLLATSPMMVHRTGRQEEMISRTSQTFSQRKTLISSYWTDKDGELECKILRFSLLLKEAEEQLEKETANRPENDSISNHPLDRLSYLIKPMSRFSLSF